MQAFEESLKLRDDEGVMDKEVSECLLYLARSYQRRGEVEKSISMSKRLYDFNGPERDEANMIMSQLNSQ